MASHSLSILLLLYVVSITCLITQAIPFNNNHFLNLKTRDSCQMKKAHLPTAVPLPPPSNGLEVKHVAIGKGTQNYTCITNNPLDSPAPNGAMAKLFDASCIAAESGAKLDRLSIAALDNEVGTLTSSKFPVSGQHFFPDPKSPVFDLRTASDDLGAVKPKLATSTPAPLDAVIGKSNKGEGAVPWLKLVENNENTGGLREVYRVNTAGGKPPKTCQGMPEKFAVEYTAEYWFYQGKNAQNSGDEPGKEIEDAKVSQDSKSKSKSKKLDKDEDAVEKQEIKEDEDEKEDRKKA